MSAPMVTPDSVQSPGQIQQLQNKNYNAQVVGLRRVHDDLMILRVRPDRGILEYSPGQYTVLGLGYWEPRVAGVQQEVLEQGQNKRLIKRAYSMSCSLLGNDDAVQRTRDSSYLEFYITLVRQAAKPPALTPRLFALREGDHLYCGPRPHGHYTLDSVCPHHTVVFVATGTGEAPHNAMLAELLARGHSAPIASVACVRHKQDLAYLPVHRQIEEMFPNYRYLTLTTREPENVDKTHPQYAGRQYLQEYFQSGKFESESGIRLTPENVRVFLCGNPAMIGVPHHTHDPARRYPQPLGMVEVLERRGFLVDVPHESGNIFFEKYW